MDEKSPNPFAFVRLDEYEGPAEPKTAAARSGLKAVWQRLRKERSSPDVADIRAELHSVDQKLLDRIAPPPEWRDASEALGAALGTWLDGEWPAQNIQVVLGPPGSATGKILSSLAAELGLAAIGPPSAEEILAPGGEGLRKVWEKKKEILVIPDLERYFLRHSSGLSLIRRLLEHMRQGGRRWLVGCDSWAWAYLAKAVRLNSLVPLPLVSQALDGRRLCSWFRTLVRMPAHRPLVFRQADDGSVVLSLEYPEIAPDQAPDEKEKAGEAGEECDPPDFTKKLAAQCRGIPLVAWAIWRNGLRSGGESAVELDARKAAAEDAGITIWVMPPDKIGLPSVPPDITRTEAFILHALLIHSGLTEGLVRLLLPFSSDEIAESLSRLDSSGLAKSEDGTWRVSLSGYPAVRRYLDEEGYMLDGF